MAEYIDREALRKAVRSKTMTKYDWSEEIDFEDFEKVLDAIPAADVAPVVHGMWDMNAEGDIIVYCNQCMIPQDMPTPYCPHCGARMDGE